VTLLLEYSMHSSSERKNPQQEIKRLQEENAAVKKQVKDLQNYREGYRRLIENLNEVLYTTDLSATVTYVSPNIEQLTGYKPEEIIGYNYLDFVCPEELSNRLEFFEKVIAGEGVATEYRYKIKDGSCVWVMTKARGIFENGEIKGVQGMLVDITERKKMEQALLESEQKYRNILETIEEGFYEINLAHEIIFCNKALCKILGYTMDELIGVPAKKFMDKKNRAKILKATKWVYKTGESWKFMDWELTRKDGSIRHIESSLSLVKDDHGAPLKFTGIARDVTERKIAEQEKESLQAQLRHAHQMEAIGTLAGGIAHDFNNILSSVIGYTELTKDYLKEGTLAHQNLSRIHEAGLRAKSLVRQILTLARPEDEGAYPVALVPLIKEALKMLRSTLPSSIELIENIMEQDLLVNADPTQLHQMIVNLATNAKHAMGNGIGRLTVSVEPIAFDKDIQKRNIDLQPGNYVHVSVTDTGAGIEDRYLNQIFDPYFTTRERGVGTGLGLPIVHGIVKSHKGHIEVKSQVGKGSTFHVYLPLLPGRELQAQEKDIPILPRGSECILIVDDEHLIVQMEQQSLERLGYTVEPRTSSIEALKAFQAQPEKFDMAIIDMTMPNMTGDTLADELKKLRPDIPIILCTGFSERIDNETHIPNIDAFLFKPVDREEMARTVRKLLDDAKKESCD